MVAAPPRPHPEVERFLTELRERGIGPISANPLPEARRQYGAMLKQVGHQPGDHPGLAGEPLEIERPAGGLLGARRYGAGRGPGAPLVVYLHGGGWALGDLDGYDGLCRALAAGAGCEVLAPEYRRAPEDPYPAALEDALSALAWAAEHCPDRPLVLAGDSAGANLAAAAALVSSERGGPRVALQVLVCPIVESELAAPSYAEFGRGYMLERADLEWFWELYCPAPEWRREPGAAPLRAPSLAGAAPALVVLAELDPLRDDGRAYAERLRASGVEVELRTAAGMTHGFFCYPRLFAAASEAMANVTAAIAATDQEVAR